MEIPSPPRKLELLIFVGPSIRPYPPQSPMHMFSRIHFTKGVSGSLTESVEGVEISKNVPMGHMIREVNQRQQTNPCLG